MRDFLTRINMHLHWLGRAIPQQGRVIPQQEPGCAVREGVGDDRLRNYHKLLREARRDTMSALERQRQVAMWKARGRAGAARAKAKRETG